MFAGLSDSLDNPRQPDNDEKQDPAGAIRDAGGTATTTTNGFFFST